MTSILIISDVESLQKKISETINSFRGIPGIYVSLNKTQKSTEEALKKVGIKTNKIFFIDCVTSEQRRDDVLHFHPTELEEMSYAIKDFMQEIKGKKFLIIDALSTLLIYNDENKVAKFVKATVDFASENNVELIAFTPKLKGEELLTKIFNFFDKVKKR
jgi:archaellum biogenesis ATPase FlaH